MYTPSRRTLLSVGVSLAGTGTLTACTGSSSAKHSSGMGDMSSMNMNGSTTPAGSAAALVTPNGPQVTAAEAARKSSGRTVNAKLTAVASTVDLGGVKAATWTFDGALPGKAIRLSAGDTLAADLVNHLPAATSVHWHGIALRNDMDGVPPITQREVAAGADFTYRFIAQHPGTYWLHPHVGVQLDRGLYAPVIVEDPHEPLKYDDEWVVVLDDWLDGVTGTPDQALAELGKGMGGMSTGSSGPSSTPSSSGMDGMGSMPGMDMGSATTSSSPSRMSRGSFMLMGATSSLLGGDAGDVNYPYYLINGRAPADPEIHTGKPGQRLRIRMINAGGDTAFRVALGGHKLTITHTDGYPVVHQQVDAVLIAPGERYDLLVTLADGVFPLVAAAEGKNDAARALVRTGSGTAPAAKVRPAELNGKIVTPSQLRAEDSVRLASKNPDATLDIKLTGGMMAYDWGLNGQRFDMDHPTAGALTIKQGQRVRLSVTNTTTMWHPIHLHGHTFALADGGPRKDTTIVLPGQTVTCDFDADNPGQWMLHCHNAYHGQAGMMGVVGYLA